MTLKQLEILVAVVEQKSFSKAAETIYLSQPSISIAIISLEEELDCKLIYRTTKQIKPTKAGKIIYSKAKEIVAICENINTIANEFSESYSGKLRGEIDIAASTVPAQFILPTFLPPFMKQHPDIKINIKQMDSQDVHHAVSSHEFELGIAGYKDPSYPLHHTKLMDDKIILISQKKRSIQLDKLIKLYRDGDMIGREKGSGTMSIFQEFMEKHSQEPTKEAKISFSSTEAVLRAAANGLGIAVVSQLSASMYLDTHLLHRVETDFELPTRSFYLIKNKKASLTKHANALIEYLATALKNNQ